MENTLPNYQFDDQCFWIEAKNRRENAWTILKQWHSQALNEDKAGYDAAKGGIMTGPWSVKTPTKELFCMEEMTKDVVYWRASLIRFCDREGRRWAQIKEGRFVISDGSSFATGEIEFGKK